MGRWTRYDADEYRLPEGMKRVGYDSDTQRYTFQDEEGLWLGEPGAEFGGRIEYLGPAPRNTSPSPSPSPSPATSPYRLIFPFFLLVCVFLLLVMRLVLPSSPSPAPVRCADGQKEHRIVQGDTCWGIAQRYGVRLEDLREANEGIVCEALRVGGRVCVPTGGKGE